MFDYEYIIKAKKDFSDGKNIMQQNTVDKTSNNKLDLAKKIELAYELQAGNYIKTAIK